MKIKKLMLVTFLLLAVLTIGAVSASDDNATCDELTLNEDSIDEIETPSGDDVVAEEVNEEPIAKSDDNEVIGETQNVTMYFNMPSKVYPISHYEMPEFMYQTFSFSNDDVTGRVLFFIDDVKYDDVNVSQTNKIYVYDNASGLEHGMHTWALKYLGDEKYNPTSLNGIFKYVTKNTPVLIFYMPSDFTHNLGWHDLEDLNREFYFYDDDVTGTVQFFIDNVKYFEADVSKTSSVYVKNNVLEQLEAGNHSWEFRYLGDEKYEPIMENGTFEYIICYDNIFGVIFPDIIICETSFTVYLPEKGDITFYINGKQISKTKCPAEEYYDIGIPYLAPYGTYNYTVVYSKYPQYPVNGTFEYSVSIVDFPEKVDFGDSAELYMDFQDDIKGYVEIYLNNQFFKKVAAADDLTVFVSGFSIGENNVTIKYLGSKYYPAQSYYRKITAVPKIKLDKDKISLTDSTKISLKLPNNANGTLIVKVNDEIFAQSDISDGNAIIELSNLSWGENYLSVSYNGTDYNVTEEGFRVMVVPKVIDYGSYLSFEFPINATGNLTIYGPDSKAFKLTIKNGEAKWDLSKVNLKSWDCKVYVEYEGNYPSFEAEFELDNMIAKINANVPGLVVGLRETDIKFTFPRNVKGTCTVLDCNRRTDYLKLYEEYYYKEYLSYNYLETLQISDFACIPDINCRPAYIQEDGQCRFDLSGKSFNLPIAFMKTGTHTLRLQFNFGDLDSNFGYETIYYNLTVNVYTGKIVISTTTLTYGDDLKVRVLDNNGKPVAGKLVLPSGKGSLTSWITDKNGYATLSGPWWMESPGTYKYSVFAAGTTKKITVKIKHRLSLKTVKVKKSAKKLVLTAKLAKKNGKYLIGKKITFKFNGKKYTKKTNKKGVAKVTISKKVLKKLKKGKKVKYLAYYRYSDAAYLDIVKKTAKVYK